MDARDHSEPLHINVRLEGVTQFNVTAPATTAATSVDTHTVVLIECGLTGWTDNPYQGRAITSYTGTSLDLDDVVDERKFSSVEELSLWLEATISTFRTKGFELIRYKANGYDIDWLQGVNLPS
jgi:hypothetical protein